MKNRLFLATAICGLALAAGISGAQADSYYWDLRISNEVRTTTTTIHIYDFPDSDPVNISRHVRKSGRCPSCSDGDQFANLRCNTESCFAYDAKVLMADGAVKKIGEVAIGDNTAYGPVRQTYIRRFDQGRMATQDFQIVYRGGLYEYRGILVTGNHVVKSNGRWVAIAELKDVRPVFAPHVGNVYNLDVEGGIIPVVDAAGAIIPFLDDKQFIAARHLVA